MSSWQSHVMGFLIRNGLKPRMQRALAKGDIDEIRKVMGHSSQAKILQGCTSTPDTIGGVKGEWLSFKDAKDQPIILYLHGGGYVSSSPSAYRGLTSFLAQSGFRVFCPDYKLAPEAKFPAQIDEALAVYKGLLEQGVNPKNLVIVGDSAGGNLALALCLSLKTTAIPQPCALALFSPCVDWLVSGDSAQTNAKRCSMFTQKGIQQLAAMYLGDTTRDNPLASPLYAALHSLPPMLIHVGKKEVLLDDSVRLADKARKDGVDVQLKIWPTVPHAWQLLHQILPEARQSLEETAQFLKQHIAHRH